MAKLSAIAISEARSSSGLIRHPRQLKKAVRLSECDILTQRQHFLVFVKILFECLKEDPRKDTCREILAESTRRNRLGDPNFTPLQPVLERRLRRTCGELYWALAQNEFVSYCSQKGLKPLTTLPLVPIRARKSELFLIDEHTVSV
jgi:hypothetical protein